MRRSEVARTLRSERPGIAYQMSIDSDTLCRQQFRAR